MKTTYRDLWGVHYDLAVQQYSGILEFRILLTHTLANQGATNQITIALKCIRIDRITPTNMDDAMSLILFTHCRLVNYTGVNYSRRMRSIYQLME